jgi:phage/plasmid primase-like uncharacterized protein
MINNFNDCSIFKQQFQDAMIQSGITPPVEIIDDGKIHRFSTSEKTNDKAGWYIFFGDGLPAGEFGCWRTDIKSKWKANIGRDYSPQELQALTQRKEAIRNQREEEFKSERLEAKNKANSIWSESNPANEHPYLVKKGISPYIARESNGSLIIPLFQNDEIVSLQYINEDGKKTFLRGGVVSGSYCTLGEIGDKTSICICEGYATGASVYESTGLAVIISFSTGNLLKVAQHMRDLHPHHVIIVAGDDDWASLDNVGKSSATQAAEAVKAKLIFPTFSEPRQKNQTDFNDMAAEQGLLAINTAFMNLATQKPLGLKMFTLKQFSLNGQSQEMKKQMLDDKYILGRIAIYGQYTVFYASPNVGKTLLVFWMLIRAIKSGDINGADVFYINADDDHKGLTYKVELAERYGFQMLAPSYNGFEPAKFFDYIRSMIAEGSAKGKIVVLDTLKKFTDVMSKDKSSEFGKIMRAFVLQGGSIICLGHTNKHKDLVGKSVYGGTSDIADDADCYYMLEEIEVSDRSKTVRFENRKSRGDVDRAATFTYTNNKVMNYQELLDSVQPISESEAEVIAQINAPSNRLINNREMIEAITSTINGGIMLKTDLIKHVAIKMRVATSKVRTALGQHTGFDYSNGDRWIFTVGAKGAHTYSLISTEADNSYNDHI